jgi:hypothetical protein
MFQDLALLIVRLPRRRGQGKREIKREREKERRTKERRRGERERDRKEERRDSERERAVFLCCLYNILSSKTCAAFYFTFDFYFL